MKALAIVVVLLSSYIGTQAQAVGHGRIYGGMLVRADWMVLLMGLPLIDAYLAHSGMTVPSIPFLPGTNYTLGWFLYYVAIAGRVNKPGRFPWRPGMTLRDLVQLARGPMVGAYLKEAEIAQAIERMLAKDAAKRWPTLEAATEAIGTPSLHDPVRQQMKALARGGAGQQALAEHHTPVSPVPAGAGPALSTSAACQWGMCIWIAMPLAASGMASLSIGIPFLASGLSKRKNLRRAKANAPEMSGFMLPGRNGAMVGFSLRF